MKATSDTKFWEKLENIIIGEEEIFEAYGKSKIVKYENKLAVQLSGTYISIIRHILLTAYRFAISDFYDKYETGVELFSLKNHIDSIREMTIALEEIDKGIITSYTYNQIKDTIHKETLSSKRLIEIDSVMDNFGIDCKEIMIKRINNVLSFYKELEVRFMDINEFNVRNKIKDKLECDGRIKEEKDETK